MHNRRSFIKNLAMGATAFSLLPKMSFAKHFSEAKQNEELIRLAVIGKGRMGTTNLKASLTTKMSQLTAVCDVYEKRLQETIDEYGKEILISRNYRDIIHSDKVDAVIIATPDHLHQKIALEAMKAGKHIYCEKPIIYRIAEGKELIRAQKENKVIFQTGSQGVSAWGTELARLITESGLIGPVNLIEGEFTIAPNDLKSFVTPKDANESTIAWDRFLENAPKRPFDAQRFFQWRGWQDYSSGLAGDLFVHVIASVHYIMQAQGPERVYSTGGLNYYRDGTRDLPEVMLSYLDYPNMGNKGAFTLALRANLVDGISKKWSSTDFTMIGTKGTMRVEWNTITLKTRTRIPNELFKGLMSLGVGEPKKTVVQNQHIYEFSKVKGLGSAHVNHHKNFLQAIKNGEKLRADIDFGIKSATAALLCNESYLQKSAIKWNSKQI
ncbi:Gfo/Idh/MocA family oxidoreductase [Dysgonomonas sp. Marseille-P4677]|uniref:Gfo/Idh/MocA family protein n=1 Tax=Dysgonomonas sp. Marseille-P4677 TaxID=2364790 RepID=UPI0019138155|nr:Gfo/Idh/MocA family oxidoreductase [Dysgonomonas sp. Marseille-P4677]MBK5719860.1 Gfo/Idh/MocA family oxidoreductase [Dysgonomonas sp. Marseille-P4677]